MLLLDVLVLAPMFILLVCVVNSFTEIKKRNKKEQASVVC